MNKIFEAMKPGGILRNLLLIPGLVNLSWVVETSQGTDPLALSWPGNTTQMDLVHDGDRGTNGFVGCSLGGTSGHADIVIAATFPSTFRLERIYAKGGAACEQGNASQTRYMEILVNDVSVYSVGLGQSSPAEWDDSTIRNGVNTVKFRLYAAYSRPSGGGFAYAVPYELELYGRI